MNTRTWWATSRRVLAQLLADKRTIGLMMAAPPPPFDPALLHVQRSAAHSRFAKLFLRDCTHDVRRPSHVLHVPHHLDHHAA